MLIKKKMNFENIFLYSKQTFINDSRSKILYSDAN